MLHCIHPAVIYPWFSNIYGFSTLIVCYLHNMNLVEIFTEKIKAKMVTIARHIIAEHTIACKIQTYFTCYFFFVFPWLQFSFLSHFSYCICKAYSVSILSTIPVAYWCFMVASAPHNAFFCFSVFIYISLYAIVCFFMFHTFWKLFLPPKTKSWNQRKNW